jgi:hypothetical protein
MAEENPVQNDLRRAFRIAWYGSAAVAIIAYAVLVPMKWHGLLPPRMTWSRVLLGPALLTSMSPISMIVTTQAQKKMLLWLCVWISSVVTLLAVVSFFDPVPDCQ